MPVSSLSVQAPASLLKIPRLGLSSVRAALEVEEIRVCTNRTCRRQGSFQTLDTVCGLAPPMVSVKSCGCLGRCGGGPNLAVLPNGLIVGHCGTAARVAEVMATLCNRNIGDYQSSIEALALRKRAEAEIDEGNFSNAQLLLSQAIDLKPFGGIHIIYRYRAVARLETGDYAGALVDANESLRSAPKYTEAYICQGDAYLAMDQYDAAEQSYATCLQIDPSIRRSKSFKNRITKLQEKFTSANVA